MNIVSEVLEIKIHKLLDQRPISGHNFFSNHSYLQQIKIECRDDGKFIKTSLYLMLYTLKNHKD